MLFDTPATSSRSTPPDADTVPDAANSIAFLRTEYVSGRLHWNWPLVFCFIRFPLLAGSFALAYRAYNATGNEHAGMLAQAFTRYNAPLLADLICIGLLLWRLRREKVSLQQLILPTRQHLFRDLLFGVLILTPAAFVIANFNVLYSILSSSALQGAGSIAVINPLGLPWHLGITLLLIPMSSSITEELVYRAYALPRLQALTNQRWLAITIMAVGFGLQHVAFSLVDWHLAIVTGLSLTIAGAAYGAFYFITKQRVLPLILLHWQSDVLTLGLAPLLLLLILK